MLETETECVNGPEEEEEEEMEEGATGGGNEEYDGTGGASESCWAEEDVGSGLASV